MIFIFIVAKIDHLCLNDIEFEIHQSKYISRKGGNRMKRLFHALFILAVMSIIIISHAVRMNAQETASEEMAPPQQTASLQETAPTESTPVQIARMTICRDVVDREPVDPGENFEASIGRLFCFTKVVGVTEPVLITHAWYFGDTERARVELPVKSSSWRTYSSKMIMANEIGDWHVEVISPDGELLNTVKFKITE
jgi:hypothetical protein